MTRCHSWSSWLYSLVSSLLFFTIYGVMWIKSASVIYIISFISKTLQNYFMIIFSFILLYFVFKVTLYCSLFGFTTLGSHFDLEAILLHSYWLIIMMVDGLADCHNFTSLKLSST